VPRTEFLYIFSTMDIGIIGSGIVGTTLGTALVGKGHAVLVGTRDEGKLREWADGWDRLLRRPRTGKS
jgi:predicted dinucleotide-binding enzyme